MWFNADLIRADFMQRSRSYSFLIVLLATVYFAYIFVPPVDASYTTIGIGDFKGNLTSEWVATISAMMSNIFLSITGFFLISNGIQKDIRSRMGQIIATTSIKNSEYLLSKMISNFFVLASIILITMLSNMTIFLIRGDYQFEIIKFIKPYVFLSLPMMFFVACVGVIAEIIFKNRTVLQGIVGYYFFSALIPLTLLDTDILQFINPIGANYVMANVRSDVFQQFGIMETKVFFGFVFRSVNNYKLFTWSGMDYSALFLLSRVGLILLCYLFVYLFSFMFHRFDIRKKEKINRKANLIGISNSGGYHSLTNISTLKVIEFKFGIIPLLITELKLLTRRSNQFFHFLTFGLWIACLFAPIQICIGILAPIILFTQLDKWSTLAVKDDDNRTIDFILSSYRPMLRIVSAQLLAAICWALVLVSPVLIRLLLSTDFSALLNVIAGCLFIVCFSYALGTITSSRKLFEVLFIVLTAALVQKPEIIGYLGGDFINVYAVITLISFIALVIGKQLRFNGNH